jgi:hypothetical protein
MIRLNRKCDVLIPSQITNQGYASEPAKQQSEPTDTLLFTRTRGARIRIEDLSATSNARLTDVFVTEMIYGLTWNLLVGLNPPPLREIRT